MLKTNSLIAIILFTVVAWFAVPQQGFAQCVSGSGPGTEMTKIINRLGLGSDCQRCRDLANQMDRGGPDWVLQNFDHVTARTISNSEKLGHRMGPVRRTGVRLIVRTAVRRSR